MCKSTTGQVKIVEDNVINYELGINGLSNFEIDKLGRIVIISISNSNKGNIPVTELTYRLQAYNFD
jgi:hypothetical protein